MILVDSSVWIDFFNGIPTPQTDRLNQFLTSESVATGDLMIAEVLQGCDTERDFANALRVFDMARQVDIGGRQVAEQAARNYRTLRALGITARKTIDTLIATRCIIDGYALLYSDRDFESFVTHLGLKDAMTA